MSKKAIPFAKLLKLLGETSTTPDTTPRLENTTQSEAERAATANRYQTWDKQRQANYEKGNK